MSRAVMMEKNLGMHNIQLKAKATQKRQWSSEFLSVFGAWQGEPLVRAPQEEASEREPF